MNVKLAQEEILKGVCRNSRWNTWKNFRCNLAEEKSIGKISEEIHGGSLKANFQIDSSQHFRSIFQKLIFRNSQSNPMSYSLRDYWRISRYYEDFSEEISGRTSAGNCKIDSYCDSYCGRTSDAKSGEIS